MLYLLSYLASRGIAGADPSLVAEPTGFEPATFCVTGRYANRYTTAPRFDCLFSRIHLWNR